MGSIATRSSVLAIKVESTEGTPVPPAGATDYLALQDDFEISPQFDTLESAELRASIGRAKPILGAENPTASGSHYLRHSGVEGQEPDYGDVIYAAFGARAIAGTEYDTASSSTTSLLKVGSGEADTFQRGEVVLIKDATNGYRIRALTAAAGTDLTLGFQVPVAPASGVNLGKCVLYYPANDSHPSLSLWHYLGNGGAVQMLAGGRVTDFSVEANAGELLNASYSIEALAYYFNPIQITSSTRYIDWEDDDGTFAAAVAIGFYKDPHELADAIQTAMNDTASTEVYTVTYLDASGKFKIVGTGTLLTIKWNTGTNTANSIASKVGFSAAADSSGTGATTGYTSPTAVSWASPYSPTLDSSDPLAVKGHEVMLGDADDYVCANLSSVGFSLSNSRRVTPNICADSGRSGSKITERTVTISGTFELQQHDVDKYRRFRTGTSTQLQYSFGIKVGGSWVPGKCGALFVPDFVITGFKISDDDGVATCEFEGEAVLAEAYLGLV